MFVPAALCEPWAQGYDARAGNSAGQPNRELVGRATVVVSGNPVVFFNAAGAPEQVSQELDMVSACLVLSPAWLDFDCTVSEVVATFAILLSYVLSLSSLVARLIGFLVLGIQVSSKATNRLGPLPLLLKLPVEMDVLVSILSSQWQTRSTSSAPMHGDSHSALPLLRSFARGTSSHSLWLQYAIECVVACFGLRIFVKPRGEYFLLFPHVASRVTIPWNWSCSSMGHFGAACIC